MAEGKAGQAGRKPVLSSRIMQMKFMQRGKDKPAAQVAAVEQVQDYLQVVAFFCVCPMPMPMPSRETQLVAGPYTRRPSMAALICSPVMQACCITDSWPC